MIFDSFLRIIQIWTRNAASHLSMEWWRRKQGSRIDSFVSLSKMSFLRLNKVEFSFSNFESKGFSIFQKKLLARSNFESFSANGEYQVNVSNQRKKNFSFEEFWTEIFYELKNSSYFYTHKYLHYVLYSFSWQGFAFSLFVPKTSFCLKIVDECKTPTYTGKRLLISQHKII